MISDYIPIFLTISRWDQLKENCHLTSSSSFDLDPFMLWGVPEDDRCTADIDPETPLELVQITCPLVRDHVRAGRRLSDLDVIIPCSPAPDVIFTWMSEC